MTKERNFWTIYDVYMITLLSCTVSIYPAPGGGYGWRFQESSEVINNDFLDINEAVTKAAQDTLAHLQKTEKPSEAQIGDIEYLKNFLENMSMRVATVLKINPK